MALPSAAPSPPRAAGVRSAAPATPRGLARRVARANAARGGAGASANPARAAITQYGASRRPALAPARSSTTGGAATAAAPLAPAITVTPEAHARLCAMLADKLAAGSGPLILRVGVKAGGCNGLSYTLDFVPADSSTPDDARIDLGGDPPVAVVCDSKALLYLFGMQLSYSSELIGGGFGFKNPNAEGECGCGKSFNV